MGPVLDPQHCFQLFIYLIKMQHSFSIVKSYRYLAPVEEYPMYRYLAPVEQYRMYWYRAPVEQYPMYRYPPI
jgi:hypothetical protein